MYWVIRWTDEQTDRDMATVVEAATRDEAEAVARGQGIPVVLIARATQSDLAHARTARRVELAAASVATVASVARYTCLGRPVGRAQLAALLLAGVATAWLHLRPILPPIV